MNPGDRMIWHPRVLGGPPREVEIVRPGKVFVTVKAPGQLPSIARPHELSPLVAAR